MAQLTDANICLRWLEECGRIDPIFPTGDGKLKIGGWGREQTPRYSAWRLSINADGHLIYSQGRRSVELARFVGERRLIKEGGGAVLLNGDGFEDVLSGVQTELRNRTRRKFPLKHVMIVPHLALTGAEIEYDSILPIHVSGDTQIRNLVYFPNVPIPMRGERGERRPTGEFPIQTISGRQFRYFWRGSGVWLGLQVRHQPRNGTFDWYTIERRNGRSFITEWVHNLGSSVFSAVGPDGERHRYISAFDSQEATPMYFLAQLPDEGKCRNYVEAVDLLAPPIVHQARLEGRVIHRQGDIFAVETDLKDDDFFDSKVTRRVQVFDDARDGMLYVQRRSAVARRLMIYGTGHTASIVAVKPNGSVFIKGTLLHDPVLERAGRIREHQNIQLSPGGKWFLAVRNTVPRATPKPPREEETRVNNGNQGAV